MKYFILKENIIPQHYQHSATEDPLGVFHCRVIYQLYNWVVVELSDEFWDIIKVELSGKIMELEEDIAIDGCMFFAEVRPVAKQFEAGSDGYPGIKIPVEMTPELSAKVVKFMYLFAKEIIEEEYTKRFEVLRDRSPLEHFSWQIQKQEAKEYLADKIGSNVPFLDYVSEQRDLTKDYLAEKIIRKATEFEDKMSTMLVDMQKLLKEFEECTAIRDINILYEKYLGVMLPTIQAVDEGRMAGEGDWNRIDIIEGDIKYGKYNF